jgi:4-carboxymuconolactone decarboxylase
LIKYDHSLNRRVNDRVCDARQVDDRSGGERWERGLDAYASQLGVDREAVPAWFAERFSERFGTEAINAAGGAWRDDELSLRDRSIAVVAALIAQGGVESRLRGHYRWATEHGVTPEQLDALVTLLAVYVGFPKASVASGILRDELGR